MTCESFPTFQENHTKVNEMFYEIIMESKRAPWFRNLFKYFNINTQLKTISFTSNQSHLHQANVIEIKTNVIWSKCLRLLTTLISWSCDSCPFCFLWHFQQVFQNTSSIPFAHLLLFQYHIHRSNCFRWFLKWLIFEDCQRDWKTSFHLKSTQ